MTLLYIGHDERLVRVGNTVLVKKYGDGITQEEARKGFEMEEPFDHSKLKEEKVGDVTLIIPIEDNINDYISKTPVCQFFENGKKGVDIEEFLRNQNKG
jgi:hypothetical protein